MHRDSTHKINAGVFEVKLPIIVYCDNIGVIYLRKNAKLSQRTKHIDVKHHFVREYIEKGLIKIVFEDQKRTKQTFGLRM